MHQAQLVEGLNPLNPNYTEGLGTYGKALSGVAGGADASMGALYQQVQQQASMLSYIDVFHAFMVFVFVVAPLALFLRPGKGGAH